MKSRRIAEDDMLPITISCSYLVPYKKIIESVTGTHLNIQRSKTIFAPCIYIKNLYVSNRSQWLIEILADYLQQINTDHVKILSLSELFRHALIYHFELKNKKKKKTAKQYNFEIVEKEVQKTPKKDHIPPKKLHMIYSHDFIANLVISYLYESQEITIAHISEQSGYTSNIIYKAFLKIRKDYPDLITKIQRYCNKTQKNTVYSLNYDIFNVINK